MKKRFFAALSGIFFFAMLLSGALWGGEAMEKLDIRSSAFGEGERIPSDFTCDGADMSPPIEWFGAPARTQSLAMIVDDPDAPAGDWVHWGVYDLPPSLTQLPMGIPVGEQVPGVRLQGRSDFGSLGYGGPCPPSGVHRYFFTVYALDVKLPLKPGATKKELLEAMQGHVLAEGRLTGTYERS
jgi:Raf kinase inhibitor-like YbhB/YbcL family protein